MGVYKLSTAGGLTTPRTNYSSFLAGNPAVRFTSYESIATVTVGSGGTSTISFTSIPATYTHLQLRMLGKTSSSDNGSGISLSINSSSFSYYHRLASFRGGSGYDSQGSAVSLIGYFPCTWGYSNNGVAAGSEFQGLHSGLWNDTSAITSLSLTAESSRTFSQYSHFALYGIKGA